PLVLVTTVVFVVFVVVLVLPPLVDVLPSSAESPVSSASSSCSSSLSSSLEPLLSLSPESLVPGGVTQPDAANDRQDKKERIEATRSLVGLVMLITVIVQDLG